MKKLLLGILGLGLLLAGCQEPVVQKVAGPKLVSCDPADGTQGLTGGELTVKMTFDQNIKCPSDKQALISIDGEASIGNINAYMTDLTIKVSGLEGGGSYVLTVPAGAVQGYRSNQEGSEEVKLTFSMKMVEPYVPSDLNPVKTLVNPKASKEAQNVYSFLLEQSGKISILERGNTEIAHVLIIDGEFNTPEFCRGRFSREKIEAELKRRKIARSDVLYMSVDDGNNINIIKKERK